MRVRPPHAPRVPSPALSPVALRLSVASLFPRGLVEFSVVVRCRVDAGVVHSLLARREGRKSGRVRGRAIYLCDVALLG